MLFRYILPILLAVLGIFSAYFVMRRSLQDPPERKPLVNPAIKPFYKGIAASGIIEAYGEEVMVAPPINGLVDIVCVEVWDNVKKGDILFKLDTRDLEAEKVVVQGKVDVAVAQKERVQGQLDRLLLVKDKRAVSEEEIKLKRSDVKIAESQVEEALLEEKRLNSLIERLVVRSPIDGTVIQKNIHPGEYVVVSNAEPAVIVGNIARLQVRADIDEYNASRFTPKTEAIGYPKNHPQYPIPLTFERIEPFVVPKKSLTGFGGEKVDTRVLQVIFSFDPPTNFPLYVGQQMDVFVDTSQE